MLTLPSTSNQGNSVGFWKIMPISSRGSVTGVPKISTLPEGWVESGPAISRSRVDLPQPRRPEHGDKLMPASIEG